MRAPGGTPRQVASEAPEEGRLFNTTAPPTRPEPGGLVLGEQTDQCQLTDDIRQFLDTVPLTDPHGPDWIGDAAEFDTLFSDLSPMFMPPDEQPDLLPPIGSLGSVGAAHNSAETGKNVQDSQSWLLPTDKPHTIESSLPEHGAFGWQGQLDACDDSPENIGSVFIHRICEALCISEAPCGNPWRQIVWPLAQQHLALYHAVAAMTCFNGLPRLRAEGLKHLETSIQKLSTSHSQQNNMSPEVTATTLLVLAMAQTWYYPRSYNGTIHLKKARGLIQALFTNFAAQPAEELPNLRFLANTWMYMDVLTRITCPNDQSGDLDLVVDLTFSSSNPEVEPDAHIDPLMGCANTLFPLIGRVADLVARVRRSPQKTNSPTIVSIGTELMAAIDRWTPSLSLSDLPAKTEETARATPATSDLVQTANAYKWATLLLLYQTVPELPFRLSYAGIARKVLVYIATVPLSSKAVFFPIFPLMVAGCEVTDAEDRLWVRNRWHSLSSLNSSGIADRCLELTMEVWERRDDSAFEPFPSPKSRAVSSEMEFELNREALIKSEMHWLSVMRDWGWEGMLYSE